MRAIPGFPATICSTFVSEGAIAFLKRQAAEIGLEYNVVEVGMRGKCRFTSGHINECITGNNAVTLEVMEGEKRCAIAEAVALSDANLCYACVQLYGYNSVHACVWLPCP